MTAATFKVGFKIPIPGQSKPVICMVEQTAESRVEALALAEATLSDTLMAYSVTGIETTSKIIEA
jgi:hypothetical protein